MGAFAPALLVRSMLPSDAAVDVARDAAFDAAPDVARDAASDVVPDTPANPATAPIVRIAALGSSNTSVPRRSSSRRRSGGNSAHKASGTSGWRACISRAKVSKVGHKASDDPAAARKTASAS
ncbi:hypothetical protein D3C72_1133350 [compost metagenome]